MQPLANTLAREAAAVGGLATPEGRDGTMLACMEYALARAEQLDDSALAHVRAILAAAQLHAEAAGTTPDVALETYSRLFMRGSPVPLGQLKEILKLELAWLAKTVPTN